MHDIISIKSVLATAFNIEWGDTALSFHNVNAIGIPLEAKLMLRPSKSVGITTGIMVYLNTEQIIYAAELGIRFGKVTRKGS